MEKALQHGYDAGGCKHDGKEKIGLLCVRPPWPACFRGWPCRVQDDSFVVFEFSQRELDWVLLNSDGAADTLRFRHILRTFGPRLQGVIIHNVDIGNKRLWQAGKLKNERQE